MRSQFPRTVRIVLTGQCNRDAILRLVSLAHRHLTKPCDAETLKATVLRACALQELLSSETLLTLTSRLETVPSMPSLYLQVVQELQGPEPSLRKVGQLIARDAGMTAKIMQVVHSAFFGLPSTVATPVQAVLYLGAETTKVLVLAANIFSSCDPVVLKKFALDDLWSHCQATSELAGRISQSEEADETLVHDATLAGLLHDTGRLILAAHAPVAYTEILTRVRAEGLTVPAAERAVLGATHAEVGAYLLGLWGLPDAIVEAVAWHHQPSQCPGETFSPLTAVHVANALAHQEQASSDDAGLEAHLDREYLQRLGLADRWEAWRTLCQAEPHEGQQA